MEISPEDWKWNEINQVGTDYADLKEVAVYDERMSAFRDVDGENREMLEMLNLPPKASVLEIGCGTGRFSRAAASAGLSVTAIDVSSLMVEYVRAKAKEESLPDVVVRHAGFLTMDFPPSVFDAVVSGAALHHLPDAWKLAALCRIAEVLKKDGQFILRDVVFSLNGDESPDDCFKRFVDSFSGGTRAGAVGHVKKEYSTYDWIMEGLLVRSGFKIISRSVSSESFFVYHCGIGKGSG